MFLFCGPVLEPTHTFPVTFCHIVLKWSESALFGCHEIHASFLWARTTITILVCHFCSGSLQPTTNLELLNYWKFFKKFAMWGTACSSSVTRNPLFKGSFFLSFFLLKGTSIHGSERSDDDFPLSSGYRSDHDCPLSSSGYRSDHDCPLSSGYRSRVYIINNKEIGICKKNEYRVVKMDCYYIGKNHHIWEAVEFGKSKNLENLLGSHKPKLITCYKGRRDELILSFNPNRTNICL
jgi:hypothetical protein